MNAVRVAVSALLVVLSVACSPAAMADNRDPIVVDGMAVCAYEDGNPDGLPCIWVSNEGLAYYLDGSNYREGMA